MSGRNTEPGRSVLSKAFAILDAMRSVESGLTRAEIVSRTGLPMTTVYRLATELRSLGALELTQGGRYRVGPWMWEMGTLTRHSLTLRDVALPFLEDLYEATHENVQLAVLDGLDALIVERIRGQRSVPIVTRVGGRLPLHATGVGKALLAFAPDGYVDRVIAHGLVAATPHTITDGQALRCDLARARSQGFAVTREEMTLDTVSVAAPVRVADDVVLGAISVVVEARTADVTRLASVVRKVAMGLSRHIAESWDLSAALTTGGDGPHPA